MADITARIYIKSSLLFLNALRSEDHLVSEMRHIQILLNGIMDPIIYAFAASYFFYQFQPFKIKQNVDFLADVVVNFVAKVDLAAYAKLERYITPFYAVYFEYVDLNCSQDFKNNLLQKVGEVDSRLASPRRRTHPVQVVANHAAEFPSKELQAHNERVPEPGREHQSADLP